MFDQKNLLTLSTAQIGMSASSATRKGGEQFDKVPLSIFIECTRQLVFGQVTLLNCLPSVSMYLFVTA